MSIMATTPSPLEKNDLVFACRFLKVTEKKLRSCHESAIWNDFFKLSRKFCINTKERFQSSVTVKFWPKIIVNYKKA